MNFVIDTIINTVVRFPNFMETAFFKKIMVIFPNKIANKFDRKIANKQDYALPLNEGIRCLEINSGFEGLILDICSGTGFASLSIAQLYPRARITGVDQSSNMVNLARQKALSRGIRNIEFKEGDASKLSFKDNMFDYVIVSNAPFYLVEIARVLKEDGKCLISMSFGGESISHNIKRIEKHFEKYNLRVFKVKKVKNGAFILCGLKDK